MTQSPSSRWPGRDAPTDGLSRREFVRGGAVGALGLWLPFRLQSRSVAWHARATKAYVGPRALDELRRKLHGALLLPGDRGYAHGSAPRNGRYADIRPLAVARCAKESDVATCVNWCVEHQVQPVARAGAHSYAGYSTTRGLLIDIGKLKRVVIDKATGIAQVGGATLNADLLRASDGGHFILPGGTCLGVGVGGLVLGGGIGFNTHWAGLTCDHLRASRIATAAGEVLEIDEYRHPDLFWACRGGAGGNFGINTSFTFQLVEVPRPEVAHFAFQCRGVHNTAVALQTFDRILQTAPPAFNADAYAQATPIGPSALTPTVDTFARGQYIGPPAELRELVQPLVNATTNGTVTVDTMPFWEMQKIFASKEAPRHSWGDLSRYSTAPLPDAVMEDIAQQVASCPSRTATANGSFWSLGWIGGPVVDLFDRRDTAYAHRNMLTLLRATPDWPDDAPKHVGQDLLTWTSEMISTIVPHTPRESYQNFPNRRIADWKREYYAENYERLVKVKTKYDPGNVFHNQQSIPPLPR